MKEVGHADQEKLHEYGPQAIIRIGPVAARMQAERALVDTGAKNCTIDPKLATELGLRKVDRQHPVTDVFGSRVVGSYLAHMAVDGLIDEPRRWCFSEYEVRTGPSKVILGRDGLAELFMSYNGLTGRVQLRVA